MKILPELDTFCATHDAGRSQVVYTKLITDLDTPVSLYMRLASGQKHSFILESVTGGETKARYSIMGMKPDLIWECHGDRSKLNRRALYADTFEPCSLPPIEALRALIDECHIELPEDLPPMSAGLFGFLGYDMIRQVEVLGQPGPDPIGTPDAAFFRPTVVVVVDNVKSEVTVISPVFPRKGQSAEAAYEIAAERVRGAYDRLQGSLPAGVIIEAKTKIPERQPNMTRDAYLDLVRRAKAYITAGDIFQVVISQRWSMAFDLPAFALYRAVRRTNPSPYMFYFDFGDYHLVGASPETLVKVENRRVTIRPLAGTRPRGDNRAADLEYEMELLADPKENAEHLMLLDLGRNDVGRVSKPGTVTPTEQFVVERYSHVMHIVSNVEGTLRDDRDALDALLSGLPAGTLSGAPKIRAMQILDEFEPEKRGVYGGGVGYFAAGGDMDICIALRTAVVKDKTLYVQAGAGVVFDSDPVMEYEECVHKSKAMFAAADDAVLFTGHRGNI